MLVLKSLKAQALTKQPRSFHPHMKRCPTLSVFREMQSKTMMRYHFTRMNDGYNKKDIIITNDDDSKEKL